MAGPYAGIILPDLLIVLPSGLTANDLAGLRRIGGVRKMITFDGAQITAAGRPASVIGVNPARFRSWVPLRAASDQALWSGLAAGDMIAADPAGRLLGLSRGSSYRLAARAGDRVRYAGSGRLDITGVDLLVSQRVSRALGLVHRVAALISAPGPSIAVLTAAVRRVLGPAAKVVVLRRLDLPASPVQPGQITSYLQLFQASAAKYCPAMSWTVLAAIGQIESADGTNMGPSSAGALGPMQFLPSTWAAWGIDAFGQTGPPDIMNPLDAVPSAARMLCADGAAAGTAAGLRQAIFAYNHAGWYVNEVLALAGRYATEYR
ncbi:MAG: lytic murein transglycosylase [Streptosporangiaceae bacterium]